MCVSEDQSQPDFATKTKIGKNLLACCSHGPCTHRQVTQGISKCKRVLSKNKVFPRQLALAATAFTSPCSVDTSLDHDNPDVLSIQDQLPLEQFMRGAQYMDKGESHPTQRGLSLPASTPHRSVQLHAHLVEDNNVWDMTFLCGTRIAH